MSLKDISMMSITAFLGYIVYTGCIIHHVTADTVLRGKSDTVTERMVQEDDENEDDEQLSCKTFSIIRAYGLCTGVYKITNMACTHEDGLTSPVYIKNDTHVRYFYQYNNRKWALSVNHCIEGALGETIEATDQPWTTNFDVKPGVRTAIDCLHYSRSLPEIPDGTMTLPNSPQQGYKYELQISEQITSINFTIYINAKAEIVADQDDLGVFHNASIQLKREPSDVYTQHEMKVQYPEDYKEEKYFTIIIENPDGVQMDTTNVTLDFVSYESPEIIVTTSAPLDTTQHVGYVSEASGITDDYDYVVDNFEEETTAQTAVTETTAGLPPDPCASISCDYGAFCVHGNCVCPDLSSCAGGSDETEICASGRTLPSYCHLEIESCNTQSTIEFVAGSCEQTSTSPAGPVSGAGAQNSETFWRHRDLIIVIIALAVAIVIIAIIVIIVCIQRRRKSRSLSVTKPDEPRVRLQPRNKAPRTPSSSSDNHRASPKPKHYMTIDEEKPKSTEIDPDRFSLTGCITPLVEETPANPFASFKPDETENRNSNDEPKPDGDSGIEELDRPNDVVENHKPEVKNELDVNLRQNPPRRNTSTTENSVYEIRPEANATFDLEVLDNAFEDDSHITTTV